ncbi:MAG: hypothetical protein QM775_03435 [Pirellulales bacterium]
MRSSELHDDAAKLGKTVGKFGSSVEALLRTHQEAVLDRQYLFGRVADVAIELYVSGCVLNRLDRLCRDEHTDEIAKLRQLKIARYYLTTARRRIATSLDALWDNDDAATTQIANLALKG